MLVECYFDVWLPSGLVGGALATPAPFKKGMEVVEESCRLHEFLAPAAVVGP